MAERPLNNMDRPLNNASTNPNYQRDLAIQQRNAPIRRNLAAAMETPVAPEAVDRKNAIIQSLQSQLQPTQRMAPTVATTENPLMAKGSVPSTVEATTPEKQLEDIAIKKTKGEALSESDNRFLFQQTRAANQIPNPPAPDLGVQIQQPTIQPQQDYQASYTPTGGQLTAEQISQMSPSEMQAYQTQMFAQNAQQQKQLLEAQQREAQGIMADRTGRYQSQLDTLGTDLNPQDQARVDQFKADAQAQAAKAEATTRATGLEQQAQLQNSAARRGFSRSSTTEQTLQKASQNTIDAVAEIENATGKAINEYQAKLLDKQDVERQKLQDKLDQSYNDADALKLQQLTEQSTLVKDLMKADPSSPDNMIKLAKDLATTRLAADKQTKADALTTFENAIKYGFMPEAMSPDQQKVLADNFGVSLSQLPKIISDAQAKEAIKNQDVSYQTDLDGNVTAVVFDKATGKISTQGVGGIGKGEATRFQAIINPITGQTRIFDPIHGVYVDGGGGKPGTPGYNQPTQPGQPGKVVISATTANTPANLRNNCVFFARSVVPGLPVGLVTSDQKRNMINTTTPQAGAVAMMPTFGDPKIGHVAVVESVNGDGTVTIVESNVRSGANGKEISRRTGTPEQLKIEGYWSGSPAKASNYTTPKTSQGESLNANQTYSDVPGQLPFERVLMKGGTIDFKQGYAAYISETGTQPSEQAYQDYSKKYYDAQSAGLDQKAADAASKATEKVRLPADKVVLLEDAKFLPGVLDTLEKTINSGKATFDPLWGNINNVNPLSWYNADQQTTNAELKRATQLIGKYMEGGVLRAEDEIKYSKMLPQATDTQAVALAKLKQVRAMLEQKTAGYISGFDKSGYDVSGYLNDPNLPGAGQSTVSSSSTNLDLNTVKSMIQDDLNNGHNAQDIVNAMLKSQYAANVQADLDSGYTPEELVKLYTQ